MRYADACANLDINPSDSLTIDIIKRQYRLKALMFHPDKNKDPAAPAKFISITESYEYILKREGFIDDDYEDTDNNDHNRENVHQNETKRRMASYLDILQSFVQTLSNVDTTEPIFHLILKKVCSMCEVKVIDLLSKLDQCLLLKTYDMLYKYQDAFHISQTLLENISKIIQTKSQHNECIILNPTLNDLYDNNVYKLVISDQLFIIPLWHHELVYDNSGSEVYVKCYPILPENMEIDNKNNIHIRVHYSIRELLDIETIHIECNQYNLPITIKTLKIVKQQRVIFAKQGIARINVHNIYNISEVSDVIVTILLE
jgi:hypothetical protein